ncbi:MAG: hydrogenase nickel incorporation protein HypB [Bacteroidales bacterium]|nr:hydrogenase nickel incorporation protein HypB [Bacteroidales bacterium]
MAREHSHSHVHTHSHDHSHGEYSHSHDHIHEHSHPHEHPNDHGHGSSMDDHHHSHDTDHAHHLHEAEHFHAHAREIRLEQDILGKNRLIAERNRGYFMARNIFVMNLVSSPGAGKTALLERTIRDLGKEISFFVIEGDQQTMNDAQRIHKTGAPVVQINTGNGCHLDAEMVHRAVRKLEPSDNSVLFIENVGNLVCPALFDLGEAARVVIMSVTEGDDKPAKYPNMFQSSGICIINKTDLLPHVDFDIKLARDYAMRANHHMQFFEMSVRAGEGLEAWYDWLRSAVKKLR